MEQTPSTEYADGEDDSDHGQHVKLGRDNGTKGKAHTGLDDGQRLEASQQGYY